jgi:serine/threonine protein kinase
MNLLLYLDLTSTGVQEIHQIDRIKGVIRWMTQKDPKQRPSLHQIIEYSPFLNPFPPPADKLQGIGGVLISNHQQRAVKLLTSLQIQYSKDHVLGISADGLSKVFLGLAVKTADERSPDWNNLQPAPVAVKATIGVKPQGEDKNKTSAVDQERKERAKILMNLNHENVVKLYSFAKNLNFT